MAVSLFKIHVTSNMHQAFVLTPSIVIQSCNPPRDTGQDLSRLEETVSDSEPPSRGEFA